MANYIWDNLFRDSHGEKSIRQKLKANYLFQDLGLTELKLIEKIINVRTYRPGELIFRQGDVGVGMYIITQGMVNIYVEEIVAASGGTRSAHVTQLMGGDFFGDLALVEENGRRNASAVAQDESTLIGFFKSDLMEVAERNPTAGVKILLRLGEVLGQRLVETTAKITEMKKEMERASAPL